MVMIHHHPLHTHTPTHFPLDEEEDVSLATESSSHSSKVCSPKTTVKELSEVIAAYSYNYD